MLIPLSGLCRCRSLRPLSHLLNGGGTRRHGAGPARGRGVRLGHSGSTAFRKAELTETADGTSAYRRRSPTRWRRPCRRGHARSRRGPRRWRTCSGRSWPASTRRPLRSRVAAPGMPGSGQGRKSAVRQPAESTTAHQRPASKPTVLPLWSCRACGGAVRNPRHVRFEECIVADPRQAPEIRGSVALPSPLAGGHSPRGSGLTPARSTTRSCSAGHPAEAGNGEAL
jgi:hypothetical protein